MTTELVRYNAMCTAIAEAHAIDEVKEIRNQAIAWEIYSRQARNIEAERKACEIRLRAERRAGQISKTLNKAPGARTDIEPLSHGERGSTKQEALEAAGVSVNQAHRWEKLADIPEDQFEASLVSERPTTKGIIAAHEPKPPVTPVSDKALWLWGTLRDFVRCDCLAQDPRTITETMTAPMRADVLSLTPVVMEWLSKLETAHT
jgi:hypothetical protein